MFDERVILERNPMAFKEAKKRTFCGGKKCENSSNKGKCKDANNVNAERKKNEPIYFSQQKSK